MVTFGWRGPDFPVDGSESSAFLDQIRAHLDALIESGFESAWIADHFVPWAAWQEVDTPTIECLTSLSYFGALYPQLTWGSIVLCQSYHNPAVLAKRAANIAMFMPGRFVFGIGAGWKDDEYAAYNFPFPSAADRIRQLDEAIQITRLLWSQPNASFDGRYYQINGATVNPRPNPVPPVMVGGGGEKLTLRVVAKRADWWNISGGSLENFKRKLDILEGHCQAVGRDFQTIVRTWSCACVAIAESQAEAERLAQASPFYTPDGAIVGDPDSVAEQLQGWVDAGVEHFQFRFADFPRTDGLELFGREVLPRFAKQD